MKDVPASQDLRNLGGQMSFELQHRPSIGPTAEQVFAALDKAGIKLTGVTQYLGSTMKAAYCAGGRSATGVVVAVCEYQTADAAKAGLEWMKTRFKGLAPDANRHLRRGTVLTLNGTAVAPETISAGFAAFDAL